MRQVRLGLLGSELRLGRRSLLLWALATAATAVLVASFYPSIRDQSSLNSIYGDLSPAAQALLGGSDLTSPVGYLSTQLFAFFLPAILLVFAVGRGAGAVAGEEEHHTLDLLLAQPIARRALYLQKSASLVAGITVLAATTWIPLAALDSAVDFRMPLTRLGGTCLQLGLFASALALCAQGVAAATGRHVVGVAVTAGYAVASYLVYGLSASVHWLTYLRPLTLWRWYLANDPLRTGAGLGEVSVLAGVAVVAATIGAAGFARRNLRA